MGRQDNGKEMENQQPHGIGKCKSVMEKPGGLENANTCLDDTMLLMLSARFQIQLAVVVSMRLAGFPCVLPGGSFGQPSPIDPLPKSNKGGPDV